MTTRISHPTAYKSEEQKGFAIVNLEALLATAHFALRLVCEELKTLDKICVGFIGLSLVGVHESHK